MVRLEQDGNHVGVQRGLITGQVQLVRHFTKHGVAEQVKGFSEGLGHGRILWLAVIARPQKQAHHAAIGRFCAARFPLDRVGMAGHT